MVSKELLEYWYPNGIKNGTVMFYGWICQYTSPEQQVLNVGAGPAAKNPVRVLRGKVARVVGVDIDPVVLSNDELDEAHITDGKQLPFADRTFDIVLSDFVLEHVEFPEAFLKEIYRVLKPGGAFFFRTPNRYHYVSVIAQILPHSVHELIANPARGLAADAHEPYPTFHRLNSRGAISKLAASVGFSGVDLRFVECEPSYMMFSTLPFLLGVLYERTANRYQWLSGMRSNIFGRLVR